MENKFRILVWNNFVSVRFEVMKMIDFYVIGPLVEYR